MRIQKCIWCKELWELHYTMLTPDYFYLVMEYHNLTVPQVREVIPHLDSILEHQRPLTQEWALKFDAAFGVSAGIWKSVRKQREDWWAVNKVNFPSHEEVRAQRDAKLRERERKQKERRAKIRSLEW